MSRAACRISLSTWLTPIDWAVSQPVVETLAAAGAELSARDLLGRTPLHHVTLDHRRGDVAMTVALLLGAGADAQVRDEKGQTVLELALSRRDGIALRALAQAGIRATAPRNASRTARREPSDFPARTRDPGHVGTLLDG